MSLLLWAVVGIIAIYSLCTVTVFNWLFYLKGQYQRWAYFRNIRKILDADKKLWCR